MVMTPMAFAVAVVTPTVIIASPILVRRAVIVAALVLRGRAVGLILHALGAGDAAGQNRQRQGAGEKVSHGEVLLKSTRHRVIG
jgi:hypothetical protein